MKHQKIKINKDKYKIFSLIKIKKIHITIETAQVRPIFFLTLVLLNPGMSCFANNVDPDQLASEEANWSGSALFAIKYANLYQQSGLSNLIGWNLEIGMAS